MLLMAMSVWLHQKSCLKHLHTSQTGAKMQPNHFLHFFYSSSVTRKKSSNVYKSCPKMISLEKGKILTPWQKLPKNVWDLSKLIAAKGFKKLPKVQKIATSGHTDHRPLFQGSEPWITCAGFNCATCLQDTFPFRNKQCDQIWWFLKVLANKFYYKWSTNTFGLFLVQVTVDIIWTTFEKIGDTFYSNIWLEIKEVIQRSM